ncbi:MAG TPA: hypothetical protein VNS09_26010 [Solirubrobacter sp.]|nr:hypothetical protein [Solirubrobacter sp.]
MPRRTKRLGVWFEDALDALDAGVIAPSGPVADLMRGQARMMRGAA